MLPLDLDGQGALTTGVGIDDEIFADSDANIYSLLTESRGDVRRVTPVAYVPDADQKQIIKELRNNMPDYLAPVIRKRETLIEDAWQSGCSIFSCQPRNSNRAKAQRESQQVYIQLAEFGVAPFWWTVFLSSRQHAQTVPGLTKPKAECRR